MDTKSIAFAADRFRFVYDNYLADHDINIYLSVIPDKNYFTAQTNGYLSMDYEEFIAEVQKNTDFARYIDITGLLELSDYYHTDSHWRQEKIWDVAYMLASEMGVTLTDGYTQITTDIPFYGVYYGKTLLPLPADELCYLENDMLENCKVYDYESDSYIPIYDPEKLMGDNPYEMFLSGPKSLLTIENPAATTEKELILFRDSFGCSLAPLLAEGYQTITLVDIRYLSPTMLDRFITFDDQDILFLYSTSILNNSITFK